MGRACTARRGRSPEWINRVDARTYGTARLLARRRASHGRLHDYGIERRPTSSSSPSRSRWASCRMARRPPRSSGSRWVSPRRRISPVACRWRTPPASSLRACHLMGEGEAMLFGDYIRLMAWSSTRPRNFETVFADFPQVCWGVRRARPDNRRQRPARPDRRDRRAGCRAGFARKLQTKGRRPHLADGPAARRIRRRTAGHRNRTR